MKYKYPILVIFLLVTSISGAVQAQVVEEYDYSKEFLWGINKNTRSGLIGGLYLKFANRLEKDVYRFIDFELLDVRHPKEGRELSYNGRYYLFGKSKSLYSMRFRYGLERIIFKKAHQQGVQININAAVGPTLAFSKDYYILLRDGSSVPYDPYLHSYTSIAGAGSVLDGMNDIKLIPGINGKLGIIFEFGVFRRSVIGLEMGVAVELLSKKEIIVANAKNSVFFPSAYITIIWGTRR